MLHVRRRRIADGGGRRRFVLRSHQNVVPSHVREPLSREGLIVDPRRRETLEGRPEWIGRDAAFCEKVGSHAPSRSHFPPRDDQTARDVDDVVETRGTSRLFAIHAAKKQRPEHVGEIGTRRISSGGRRALRADAKPLPLEAMMKSLDVDVPEHGANDRDLSIVSREPDPDLHEHLRSSHGVRYENPARVRHVSRGGGKLSGESTDRRSLRRRRRHFFFQKINSLVDSRLRFLTEPHFFPRCWVDCRFFPSRPRRSPSD